MRHNYKPQEREYSCGPAALRNCLIHFGKDITEKTVRMACETKKDGTDEDELIAGCEHFGFETKEIVSVSPNVFKRRLLKGLKNGKVFIVSSADHNHWIPVLEYKNRKLKVVDSDYQKEKKSIVQYITTKQMVDMTFCYDKFTNKKQFYALELSL